MSAPMTFQEFRKVLQHIDRHNSPNGFRSDRMHSVKYVDPHIDMRTGSVFSVTFRGFSFDDINFNTQNENSNLTQSLYERIIQWLETPYGELDE